MTESGEDWNCYFYSILNRQNLQECSTASSSSHGFLIKGHQSKTASNVTFASYDSKILPYTRPLQRLLLGNVELKIAIE